LQAQRLVDRLVGRRTDLDGLRTGAEGRRGAAIDGVVPQVQPYAGLVARIEHHAVGAADQHLHAAAVLRRLPARGVWPAEEIALLGAGAVLLLELAGPGGGCPGQLLGMGHGAVPAGQADDDAVQPVVVAEHQLDFGLLAGDRAGREHALAAVDGDELAPGAVLDEFALRAGDDRPDLEAFALQSLRGGL